MSNSGFSGNFSAHATVLGVDLGTLSGGLSINGGGLSITIDGYTIQLGNPGYSVSAVVRILGYASPSHLAGAARRVAGASPQELRALGPRGVLVRFLRGRTRSRP